MPRFTYNGVVVETSDEVAARLPSGYEPVKEKSTTSTKTTTKKASSSKSEK